MANISLALALLQEGQRFLAPLGTALKSEADFSSYLAGLGWTVPPSSFSITAVTAAVGLGSGLADVATELGTILGSDDGPDVESLVALIGDLRGLVAAMTSLTTSTAPAGIPAAAWSGFTTSLADDLLSRYLAGYHPRLLAAIIMLGLVEGVPSGTATPAVMRSVYRWDRLATVFGDPAGYLEQVYGWAPGQSPDVTKILDRLAAAVCLLDIPVSTVAGVTTLALYQSDDGHGNSVNIGIAAEALPGAGGFRLTPSVVTAGTPMASALGPFSVTVDGSFAGSRPALELSPGGLTVVGVPGDITGSLTISPPMPRTVRIFGTPDSHHLQIGDWSLGLALSGTSAAPVVELQVTVSDGSLVIAPGELDGFIGKLLGDDPMVFAFAGLVGWSAQHGFRFQGQASLTLTIPLDLTIGVATIDALTITVAAGQGPLQVDLTVDGSVAIGPVAGSIEGIGIRALMAPAAAGQSGLFGGIEPSFGFKPPTGLGLGIDSGPISGGGYLFFDADNERYAGIATVSFKSFCITVVGLLTTRMPDGSEGFSLLLIITAQFPPIQLGFGFTLNGLGGLVGINRTMMVDPLRDGIKHHTVDAVMFPPDPIRNAPQIISDLTAIFPPAEGCYTFGPMVILGWGSPPILSLELGVILELPSPLRLVILGKVTLMLPVPDEQLALLLIRMDMIGIVDFDLDQASFDATLVDSRLVQFPITGDMAMRMSWGQDAAFALAVGGFNPRFTPPPAFPALDLVAISIATGDNPRIRLSAYLALTANSLQAGAHLDLFAHADLGFVGDFSVTAYLGFDVLIHFDPFSLVADLAAGVTINRNGNPLLSATLAATLSGPAPWHGWGKVTFDCLGTHSISFDVSIGPAQQPTLSPVDVFAQVQAAFEDHHNWSASLPGDTSQLVTIRAGGPDDRLYAHPLGGLTVRQRVVPLDHAIAKFGNALPSGDTTFTITAVTVPGLAITRSPVSDDFAPGQYDDLSDDEQLARPAFESMESGADLSLAGLAAPPLPPLSTGFGYEEAIIDVDPATLRRQTRRNATPVVMPMATMTALAGGAGARAAQRSGSAQRFAGPARAVAVLPRRFVVAGRDDLRVPTGLAGPAATGTSYAQAAHVAGQRPDADAVQVVGADEARP